MAKAPLLLFQRMFGWVREAMMEAQRYADDFDGFPPVRPQ
jgi:hypothetical protein